MWDVEWYQCMGSHGTQYQRKAVTRTHELTRWSSPAVVSRPGGGFICRTVPPQAPKGKELSFSRPPCLVPWMHTVFPPTGLQLLSYKTRPSADGSGP